MKTPRRRAREFAVQGIYQWQLNALTPATIEKNLRDNEQFAKADEALFRTLLYGVLNDPARIESAIASHFERAPEDVSPVERAVLLMAAFELTQQAETPLAVIINEAIEIAKTFGGAEGHRFVHGVLDQSAADVRPEEFEAVRSHRRNKRPAADKPVATDKPAAAE